MGAQILSAQLLGPKSLVSAVADIQKVPTDLGGEIPTSENPASVIAARRKREDDPYIEKLFDARDTSGRNVPFVDVIHFANYLAKSGMNNPQWRTIYWKLTGDSNLSQDLLTSGKDGGEYDVLNHLLMQGPEETTKYIKSCIAKMDPTGDTSEQQVRQLTRYAGFLAFMKEYGLIGPRKDAIAATQNDLSQALYEGLAEYFEIIKNHPVDEFAKFMQHIPVFIETLEKIYKPDSKELYQVKALKIVELMLEKGLITPDELNTYPHIKEYFEGRSQYGEVA